MAEPVTDTAAWDGDGAGGDATEVVADGLAWSADDGAEEPLPRQWRDVAGIAAAILAACTLVAVMLVWVYRDWEATRRPNPWDLPGAHRTEDPTSSSASPPAKVPVGTWTAMTLPTETAQTQKPLTQITDEQDATFLAALQRSPGLTITNREAIISSGRGMCVLLDQGHSFDELVGVLLRANPTLAAVNARDVVHGAEAAYCPWRLGE